MSGIVRERVQNCMLFLYILELCHCVVVQVTFTYAQSYDMLLSELLFKINKWGIVEFGMFILK